MDWTPIIWAVIILAAVGLLIWLIAVIVSAVAFNRVRKDITSPTNDPFDAPFFKNSAAQDTIAERLARKRGQF